jgi:FdhD protein
VIAAAPGDTPADPKAMVGAPWLIGVLAGGRSSRFITDKARALWRGRPLISHVVDLARRLGSPSIILADRADRYADFSLEALVDQRPGLGPLAGLEALLVRAQAMGLKGGLLLSCDTQGLRAEWLGQLIESLESQDLACAFGDASLAHKAEGWQPLPMLVRVEALPQVQRALDGDQRSLWRLLGDLGARPRPLPALWHAEVVRVDSRADLLRLPQERPLPLAVLPAQRWRVDERGWAGEIDQVATEEPLEIRVQFGPIGRRRSESAGVTLRTPGQDGDLAAGWLLAAGIVREPDDILGLYPQGDGNTLRADLRPGLVVPWARIRRVFHATASCGVCGAAAVEHLLEERRSLHDQLGQVAWSQLRQGPEILRSGQPGFAMTGGLHAAALVDLHGELIAVDEDVGRHNAVDKVLGRAWLRYQLADRPAVLLLSGRAGFELVQKALVAGVATVAAVGAPTALAIDLADRAGMTLVGFLRNGQGNVYCGKQRIRWDN